VICGVEGPAVETSPGCVSGFRIYYFAVVSCRRSGSDRKWCCDRLRRIGSRTRPCTGDAQDARGEAVTGTVGNSPNPWIQADSRGRFGISVSPGRYKISARDDVDGYPDPAYWLNADPTAIFPEVTIGQKDVANLRVVLGKRGGILAGEVIDQTARKPIPNGKVAIVDARNKGAYVEVFADAYGQFQFTVPSKLVLVSATAPRYKAAAFAAGAGVTLSGGEHRQIVFELEHE
jgi:hypothetical protein